MKTCKNCGIEFQEKNNRAVYCSDSCRVSHYQKEKRLKEKKPINAVLIWIKKNISKAAVWFFLIVLFMFSIPYVFDKGMRIYKDYRVEWQNERLEELEERFSKMNQEVNVFEENKKLKGYLKGLLNPDNLWLSEDYANQYKEKVMGKDVKLLEN